MTGQELKAFRLRKGLTQSGLATQLGITRGQVAKLESGRSTITLTIKLLLKHLHL